MSKETRDYLQGRKWIGALVENKTILSEEEYISEVYNRLFKAVEKNIAETAAEPTEGWINRRAMWESEHVNKLKSVRSESYEYKEEQDYYSVWAEIPAPEDVEPQDEAALAEVKEALQQLATTAKQRETADKVYAVLIDYMYGRTANINALCDKYDIAYNTYLAWCKRMREDKALQERKKKYYSEERLAMIIDTNKKVKGEYKCGYNKETGAIYGDYKLNKHTVVPEDRSDEKCINDYFVMCRNADYKAELEREAKMKAQKEALSKLT